MGKSRKEKSPCRGDTRGGPWVGIPQVVIKSAAFRSLSLWARAVLLEILAAMNGFNNGKVAISFTQISDHLGNTNRGAIGRAIAELMERGLLDVGMEGSWSRQRAREYRLTFVSTPGRAATNDYLFWKKSGGEGAAPQKREIGNGARLQASGIGKASLPRLLQHRRKTANFSKSEHDRAVTVCDS